MGADMAASEHVGGAIGSGYEPESRISTDLPVAIAMREDGVLQALRFAERLAVASDKREIALATADVVQSMGQGRVAIALRVSDSTVVHADAGWDRGGPPLRGTRCRVDEAGTSHAIRTTLGRLAPEVHQRLAAISVIVFPLHAAGMLHGLLIVEALQTSRANELNALPRIAGAAASSLARVAETDAVRVREDQDPLTGVATRGFFEELLARELKSSSRPVIGVVSCDLDRFRRVNEALGHLAGDDLLRLVAQRLAVAAGPDAPIARLGGDEFVVAFPGLENEEQIELRVRQLEAALRPPMSLSGQLFYPTASFGRAVTTKGAETASVRSGLDLLRTAEADMQAVKERRRNRPPEGAAFDLLELDAHLHAAVDGGEVRAYFQPLYDLLTGDLIGFEALARWLHPDFGFISPEVFIALAEDSELIHELGVQMIGHAYHFLATHPDPHVKVYVNVSAKQISTRGFADRLASVFDARPALMRRLTVEVTESALLLDLESIKDELRHLRRLGIGVAIDDFGSGYSSLAQLQDLPVTELKIDQTLVRRSGAVGERLIETVVQLAAALRLVVIAEGVERAEQLQTLRRLRCDRAQGYLFSPALPAELARALPRTIAELLSAETHSVAYPAFQPVTSHLQP